ncbi:MAG: AraC family transcriptional regulator [Roseivirga sp.]|nr:AraC family transcriptional regulator [Roseivirga sp.]
MALQSLTASLNSITTMDDYSLIVLTEGSGVLEVDFSNYSMMAGKAIFLSPGQYFRNISGNLEMSIYRFEGDRVNQVKSSRYLFKHLVSLGYIDVSQTADESQPGLKILQVSDDDSILLETAVKGWLQLNPFGASSAELELLFDLKDFVDLHFHESLTLDRVAGELDQNAGYLKKLTRAKLAATVHKLTYNKMVTEARRKVAFTDLSTKEVAYELGFSYPSYFNRFFKQNTNSTPQQFREDFGASPVDGFVREFSQLLDSQFKEQRFMGYYAEAMYLSVKSLSAKIRSSFGTSFNELMNQRLLLSGKQLLASGESVKETAYALGFKEPNHFSAFFKTQTGASPSGYFHS